MRFILFVFTILVTVNLSGAQECGPSCPVCSGSGDNTGGLLAPGILLATGLYLPDGDEETGVLNIRYGLIPWMDIGTGYTIDGKKPIWSIRIQPLSECEENWRPGLILGTGSVQTGGSDQSVFAQLTKAWEFSEGYSVRFSGGLATISPDFNEGYGLAGMTFTITESFSPFARYDGRNFHFGLAWIPTEWFSIAGLLVEEKTPAFSAGFRWNMSTGGNSEE